jgi:hypothetical protein
MAASPISMDVSELCAISSIIAKTATSLQRPSAASVRSG